MRVRSTFSSLMRSEEVSVRLRSVSVPSTEAVQRMALLGEIAKAETPELPQRRE